MMTFVAEVQYPKGPGIICAVSFQPMFPAAADGSINFELTFLATRLSAEGSGMAIWLIYQVFFFALLTPCFSFVLPDSPFFSLISVCCHFDLLVLL